MVEHGVDGQSDRLDWWVVGHGIAFEEAVGVFSEVVAVVAGFGDIVGVEEEPVAPVASSPQGGGVAKPWSELEPAYGDACPPRTGSALPSRWSARLITFATESPDSSQPPANGGVHRGSATSDGLSGDADPPSSP